MKKILLIILSIFVFSGCVVIEETKKFIPIEKDIFKYDEYKITSTISDYEFCCFIHFGVFRSQFSRYSPSTINLYFYGFDNINDIKINSYTIKKNNKKIKKKLKFKKNF